MAKVKIEGLLETLEAEFKKAIQSTLRKQLEEGSYNEKDFISTFKKELIDKCNTFENIPNKYIKNN